MDRLKSILIALLVLTGYVYSSKLDPQLYRFLSNPQTMQNNTTLKKDGLPVCRVLVSHEKHVDISKTYHVLKTIGSVSVVDVNWHELQKMSTDQQIIYVESPKNFKPYLDKSTKEINVDRVRNETGLTGENVLVGIVDSGIDYTHHDFLNPDNRTRIKYLVDFGTSGSYYGGTLYTEHEINNALQLLQPLGQNDYTGHGTHVAGIAAGDGSDNSNLGIYTGVAPKASLVVVKGCREKYCNVFTTADQILALAFIDSVADVLNMPYVINLSLGGHSGAHDGTSPVERVIDQLVGSNIPGKAIVVAGGNERDMGIHAQATLSRTTVKKDITFSVADYSKTGDDRVVFDGWYDGNQRIAITIMTPNGNSYGPVPQSGVLDKATSEGNIYIWNGFYDAGEQYHSGINPFNGDKEFYIDISSASDVSPRSGNWSIQISGLGGTVDVWQTTATMDVSFVDGNEFSGKVSIPGTAENAITVGGYITKKAWNDFDGNRLTFDTEGQYSLGQISSFSNPGPTRDGRQKPDLAAPGQIITSTLSSLAGASEQMSMFNNGDSQYPNAFIQEGGGYALASGTSMAAPHVTGAVALILQKYPQATATQIKDMLLKSSTKDNWVGSIPNDDWGYGKLDIYAALNLTPGEEAPLFFELSEIYPNPFTGRTRIQLDWPLEKTGDNLSIDIYNVLGKKVKHVFSGKLNSDTHDFYWDGRDESGFPLASGVYFLKFKTSGTTKIKKMMYLGQLN